MKITQKSNKGNPTEGGRGNAWVPVVAYMKYWNSLVLSAVFCSILIFPVILKLCYNSLHKTNLSCSLILSTNFDFDGPMFFTHNTISGETSRGEV